MEYHGMSGDASIYEFSEVTIMCNNGSCGFNIWWIIILAVLFCCCGNGNGNIGLCGGGCERTCC